jgi:F-type H+-transporting ATPase subunit delta
MSGITQSVAKVYAQALVQVGQDQQALGRIYDDLKVAQDIYASEIWFREFFTSPRIDRQEKWKAVRAAFEGRIGPQVLGLLKVLIMKGREAALDNVFGQYVRFKDEHENRLHAYVTVAAPLEERYRDELVKRLCTASGKNVDLHEHVDPGVIGGASLRVGDKVIDRTLRSRLDALRKHLLNQSQGDQVVR